MTGEIDSACCTSSSAQQGKLHRPTRKYLGTLVASGAGSAATPRAVFARYGIAETFHHLESSWRSLERVANSHVCSVKALTPVQNRRTWLPNIKVNHTRTTLDFQVHSLFFSMSKYQPEHFSILLRGRRCSRYQRVEKPIKLVKDSHPGSVQDHPQYDHILIEDTQVDTGQLHHLPISPLGR